MANKIQIVPHDHEWLRIFKEEANRVKQALGMNCVTVLHVGSTSVPGLAAKPIIDMIPIVKNILTVDSRNERMAELGFTAAGEAGVPFRRFFQKESPVAVNVHVFEKHNPEIDRHLRFRDYLREHPADVKAYAALKTALVADFPNDLDAYNEGKAEFIQGIDAVSGFEGLCMVQAKTKTELAAYEELTGAPLEQKADNYYFILRHSAEIVAAARVEFLDDDQVVIHKIAIKTSHIAEDLEGEMAYLLERWVEEQDLTLL